MLELDVFSNKNDPSLCFVILIYLPTLNTSYNSDGCPGSGIYFIGDNGSNILVLPVSIPIEYFELTILGGAYGNNIASKISGYVLFFIFTFVFNPPTSIKVSLSVNDTTISRLYNLLLSDIYTLSFH